MFERVISFVGDTNYSKIKNTTVLVVGLGGVGGYAVESLARSGIENIIAIDHDIVEKSNLNRQIFATSLNIGEVKALACLKRVKSINPNCHIFPHKIFLDENTLNILDNYHFDYLIDACDHVPTKKLLIDYSIKHQIKLISCMGTANKIDPTKLTITDIRKTSYDPLAKILRKYVNDLKTNTKIMVVSSTETPIRKDCLSSLIFVPASAGLLCANYIIKDIINSENP